jgi:hypothetical protein
MRFHRPMPAPRQPKKSESLEVRIPFATKQAFMARCRADGLSASEATRAFIDAYLERSPARRPSMAMRLVIAALIAGALGAVAVPSLARVVQPAGVRAEFHRLDANRDGLIDFREFSAGGAAAGPTSGR